MKNDLGCIKCGITTTYGDAQIAKRKNECTDRNGHSFVCRDNFRDNPPLITDKTVEKAQQYRYDIDPNGFWCDHILMCEECSTFHGKALAGSKREIARKGLPVSDKCRECEKDTMMYEVNATKRRLEDS